MIHEYRRSVVSELSLIVAENKGALIGKLTRHEILNITEKNYLSLISNSTAILDLNKITKVDTAGLAWLFYILEQANDAACKLIFINLPEKLNKLIELSCVDGFLPSAVE